MTSSAEAAARARTHDEYAGRPHDAPAILANAPPTAWYSLEAPGDGGSSDIRHAQMQADPLPAVPLAACEGLDPSLWLLRLRSPRFKSHFVAANAVRRPPLYAISPSAVLSSLYHPPHPPPFFDVFHQIRPLRICIHHRSPETELPRSRCSCISALGRPPVPGQLCSVRSLRAVLSSSQPVEFATVVPRCGVRTAATSALSLSLRCTHSQ